MDTSTLKQIQTGVNSQWLLDALSKKGINLTEVCQELDLKNSLLQESETILSPGTYNRIFDWGAQKLNDPDLGIHLAETLSNAPIGLLGYLVNNASTLEEWGKIVERYICIVAPDYNISFEHINETCRCYYHSTHLFESESYQDISFTLGILASSIRDRVGANWTPNRCSFTYAPPSDLTEHQRIFGNNLHFNQPRNSFDIDEKLLPTPIPQADPELLTILRHQADFLLNQLKEKKDLVQHIRLLITTSLGSETLDTETLARHLNMSVRKLHQKLSKRNTSFREIRYETIMQIAKEALLNSDASMTDIALKLGYSESSAFVRVFKRQTGVSPLQFRKQGLLDSQN